MGQHAVRRALSRACLHPAREQASACRRHMGAKAGEEAAALVVLQVGHQPACGSTKRSTALAKPSSAKLSVTAVAWAFTWSLALPMAMEKPDLTNISTSFGMSPI